MQLLGILLAILVFALCIFVHELGHFLVARWCGLEVRSFSIGFGKAIWRKTVNGVEYRVGILPFGGYVMLPQMYAGIIESEDYEEDQLPTIHPIKKILVALAGGAFNVLFALLLALVVYVVGIPATPDEQDAVIGYVDQESPAYAAGVRVGQELLSVRGEGESRPRQVRNYRHVFEECALFKRVELEVRDGERVFTVELETTLSEQGGIHFLDGLGPRSVVRIGGTLTNGPARAAGLLEEDIITHLDDEPLFSWAQMVDMIRVRTNQPTALTVKRRNGEETHETLVLTMTPIATFTRTGDHRLLVRDGALQPKAMIGIAGHSVPFDFEKRAHPGPFQQLAEAAGQVFRVLRAFTSPKTAGTAARAISGPVGIFAVLLYMVKQDLMLLFAIAVVINVNLAIVNLLPLPVLDGGHITFALYRLVTGREPPKRFMVGVTNVFVVLLLCLLVFLVFRDYFRYFSKPDLPEGIELLTPDEAVDRKLITREQLDRDPFHVPIPPGDADTP